MTENDPLSAQALSLKGAKTYALKDRTSKVGTKDFGHAWVSGGGLSQWLDSLPRILAANDLRDIAGRLVRAADGGRPVILALGAHAIKVGLNPVIIDLIQRGIVTAIALNGAGIIHDAEVAMVGSTSEDVSAGIGEGTFGMAEETARFLNEAISKGASEGLGLGESVGAMLTREGFPHTHLSLLAQAHECHIPATVHVALGTDIIHIHPSVDGAAIGQTSHLDFRLFATLISRLQDGVFINLGSAVILPEVFLKALSLVRNTGFEVDDFTTVNMDFIRQYRPMTNVVNRPTLGGGKGYALVGHHEIMFPLLAAAVIEGLNDKH